ncbi:MAG: hypothetical protein ACRDY3_11560 [Acidimicrobiales bacterium]
MRKTGSHLRLTTLRDGGHRVTVPARGPLRVELAAILSDVAEHQGMTGADLEERLFG